jgi:single-strand selective monofunctional uracil DNA glycosylase
MKVNLKTIANELAHEADLIKFSPPVEYVYNPLIYARLPYAQYLDRYGKGTREIILLGMNPGPWGMAQTGVPFGDVEMVAKWLSIKEKVGRPQHMHPKRPVEGFHCPRSEVSGKRLWSWARDRFGQPEKFFQRYFVANYCPLSFLEESGRNRTPDKLPKAERDHLFAICDKALYRTAKLMRPRYVIGIGKFAAGRAAEALKTLDIPTGCITHPSPANPRANRGWAPLIENELQEIGITL